MTPPRKPDYPLKWRIHRRLFHKISDLEDKICDVEKPWFTDERAEVALTATEFAQKVVCFFLKHSPVGDQCGIPAHDFCAFCGKPMPYQAHRSFV